MPGETSGKRTPDSLKAGANIVKKVKPLNNDNKKGIPLVLNERNADETAKNAINTSNRNEDMTSLQPASVDDNDSRKAPTMQGKVGKVNRKQKRNKNNRGRKQKLEDKEVEQGKKGKEKKENVGGLIFLCSAKTKPDCLKYRVMGVPESQKDVVLAVKPGLKLFLYDFDLKLMYGIYKASSSGGKKIEPRAFGGSFPYQAMMENFTTKHKFKTELTFKQAKKLSELFQSVEVQSRSHNSPPCSARMKRASNRRARKSSSHLQIERMRDNHYAGRDERRHTLVPHEGDRPAAVREVIEEPPQQMFPTEAEYRAYGLQGEIRYIDIHRQVAPHAGLRYSPPVDPHWEYHRSRRPYVLYRDAVPPPPHREYVSADSRYPDYRNHQSYTLESRRDYYPLADRDRHLDYHRTTGIASSESYPIEHVRDYHMRETDLVDRLRTHSSHAEYDLIRRYQIVDLDSALLPVSSRYSFAGPR